MDNNEGNSNFDNITNQKQPNIAPIPDISSIPPLPELKNDENKPGVSGNIEPETQILNNTDDSNLHTMNQQPTQIPPQTKGFDLSHLEYSKQQQQYANQNLGYANNTGQSGSSQNNYSQQQNYVYGPNNNMLIKIPNSGGILSLGILSIISICCCGGLLAPILSIIALAMIPKAKRLYFENPKLYKPSSLNNIKAGQICAIIGLALAIILWIYLIILAIIDGINMNDVNEAINEAWNQTGY